MALPASFNTITITGTYVDFHGVPATGTVTFSPPSSTFLKATAVDVMIVPKPVVVTLDAEGSFSVLLPVTDDPDVVPSFTYGVTENVTSLRRTYDIEIPSALLPGPVDLSDLAQTGSVTVGTTALTRLVADALYAPIGSGGASTVDELTDATAIGKTVVKAADAAAVRTAIGAGTSSLALGTTSSTAKAGDYQPTAANISDSTTTGRSVLTAASAAAARTAIGAGTSSLALGTTGSTAKAGDYQPTAANISDSTTVGRSVLTAADAAAARTAIGAGTSNLALGTTSTTAKAGDYAPPAASETATGLVELATTTEARTGTDTARAVTPAGMAGFAMKYVALSGVTLSGRFVVAPDGATYTGGSDKITGDIVATLAP